MRFILKPGGLIYTFFTSHQFIGNLHSGRRKVKHRLRLSCCLKCIVSTFFHCYLGKCTQMHVTLSNFEPNIRINKQFLRLMPVSDNELNFSGRFFLTIYSFCIPVIRVEGQTNTIFSFEFLTHLYVIQKITNYRN